MNIWLLGTQKVGLCLEGCKKSWWGKGEGDLVFFLITTITAVTANSSGSLGRSLIYWWAARLSLTHRCLPLWRARFHCATLCSKLLITTNGNRSRPRVNWRLTKKPQAWQLLVSANCVCSQGLLENLNTFSVKDTFIPFLRKATSYDNTELKSSKCFTLPDKRQTQEDGNYFMFFSSVKSMNLLSSFNSLYWVWQSLFCHSVLLPNGRAIFPSAL